MNTEVLDSYPKYESYQDSGVDWLGEIPADWQLLKVRNVFRLSNKFAEKNNSHELLSVYTDIGVKPRRELEARGNKASTTDGYLIVEKGDIVVNKLLAWMGAIGYSNYDGVTSPAYDILKPIRPVSSMFYHFLFRTPRCVSELKRNSRGIMDMRLRLYFDKFGNVLVPYPSLEEQEKIISFLNDETAKVDQAIELKQQQIERLNEYKQITIQNAVTKGLNANAKMKYSGVDWIGDIPEHWAVNPGMNIFSENKRSNKGLIEDTVLSLSYGEVIIKPLENMFGLMPESFETYQIINPNDIIIRCMDLQNDKKSLRTGISRYRGIITSAYLCLRVDDNYSAKFFYHYIHSLDTTKIIYKFGSGLRQNLSFRDFRRMPVVVPPIDEQILIVNKIQDVTDSIERTVLNQKKQIERLKEYKTILINQAVTGKIKVS